MKQRSIFSRETFEYTCGEYRFKSIDKNFIKKSLTDFGYKITNSENSYPKEKINMVDESYRGFDMEKDYKIRFSTRLSFST
jgi:hypothetical protein